MSEDTNNNVLPKVALGAAIIGGVAAVAAVALGNEDNRKSLKEGIDKVADKGAEVVDGMKEKGADMMDDAKEKAAQVGSQALAMVTEEYKALRAKIDEFVKGVKDEDSTKELQKSAEEIAELIKTAKSETEDRAQQLVGDIKESLAKLSESLEKLEAKKQD